MQKDDEKSDAKPPQVNGDQEMQNQTNEKATAAQSQGQGSHENRPTEVVEPKKLQAEKANSDIKAKESHDNSMSDEELRNQDRQNVAINQPGQREDTITE